MEVFEKPRAGILRFVEDRKPLNPRVNAVLVAARYYGVELDPQEFAGRPDDLPTSDALAAWLRNSGMWVRQARLRWRDLMKLRDAGPIVLLFTDGGAGLLTGVNSKSNVVFIKDPQGGDALPIDELRLSEVWQGAAVLLRAERGAAAADAPFTLSWLARMVIGERRSLRDIGLASLTLSFLTIFPPLLVM